MMKTYYRKAKGSLLVYDGTSRSSFLGLEVSGERSRGAGTGAGRRRRRGGGGRQRAGRCCVAIAVRRCSFSVAVFLFFLLPGVCVRLLPMMTTVMMVFSDFSAARVDVGV